MLVKHFSVFSLLFIGFLFFTAQPIKACQCGEKPTVLTSFNQAENVFIGEIIEVGKIKSAENKNLYGATFLVKKVYKGSLKEGDTKFFEQGIGDDCQMQFEKMVGGKLLVYDNDSSWGKRFRRREGITFCGRSTNVQNAKADFLYLDNLEKLQGKTRIYGKVWFAYDKEKLQYRRIQIIGKDQTYEVITDKNGIYEIYDLPAGEYFLEPEIPKGWKLSEYFYQFSKYYLDYSDFVKEYESNRFSVKLLEKSDASLDFSLFPNNSIQGKVTDVSSNPLKGVCIYALRTSETKLTSHNVSCTNENGLFSITQLDKDSYHLIIGGDGIRPTHPFGITFYPGVRKRSEAAVVNISEGETIQLKDFKISEILETINLNGFASYSDGSPVTWGGQVEFIPDIKDENIKGSYPGEFRNFTKEDGGFSLKVFKGQAGKIRLEKLFNNADVERCPEIKKAVIEKRTEQTVTVATQWLEIKADQDLRDIKLTFPFPYCSKGH